MNSRWGMLVICLLLASLFPLHIIPAQAQSETPNWQQILTCDQFPQKYQGLEVCTTTIQIPNVGGREAYVVVVDLQDASIHFEYVIAKGYDRESQYGECKDVNIPRWSTGVGCYSPENSLYYPILPITRAVSQFKEYQIETNDNEEVAVVINGDYSACTKMGCNGYLGHGPEGFAVVHGLRIDGPANGDFDLGGSTDPNTNNAVLRPWVAISQNPPFQIEIGQIPVDVDDGDKYRDWIYTAMGGGPWIIKEGRVIGPGVIINGQEFTNLKNLCDETNPGSCYNNTNQTSVGLTQDNRWFFLILVENETANLDFTARLMQELQVWQAIKFDGGGSSQLYYIGASDPNIEQGDQRWLTNFLVVAAQYGNGISDPEEPPLIPPGTDPSWWEKLWRSIWDKIKSILEGILKSIDEAWQDQRQSLDQKLKDWWQGLLDRLTEELIKAWKDWLDQMCGSALLPAGMVTGVWYWRQRRRRGRS